MKSWRVGNTAKTAQRCSNRYGNYLELTEGEREKDGKDVPLSCERS
jgi:hypothetical protein